MIYANIRMDGCIICGSRAESSQKVKIQTTSVVSQASNRTLTSARYCYLSVERATHHAGKSASRHCSHWNEYSAHVLLIYLATRKWYPWSIRRHLLMDTCIFNLLTLHEMTIHHRFKPTNLTIKPMNTPTNITLTNLIQGIHRYQQI
jgi:hypothetical protein